MDIDHLIGKKLKDLAGTVQSEMQVKKLGRLLNKGCKALSLFKCLMIEDVDQETHVGFYAVDPKLL